jgi:hypothetical protein
VTGLSYIGVKKVEYPPRKPNDYRRKFKEHYGLEFGKNYVIHHIDGNHDNNSIDNLMVIPRGLHSGYHSLKACVLSFEDSDYEIKSLGQARWHQKVAEKFWSFYSECCKWYEFKLFLDWMPHQSFKGIDLS